MNVLLVHGLGRSPLSLFGLAAELRKAGHRTGFFAYLPAVEPLPSVVRRLSRRLERLARDGRPVGLVGHSLGGLLLRLALPSVPNLPVRRLVMLGTPNRPPRLAARAWRVPPFRWLTGGCGRFLATAGGYAGLPPVTVPYTLIAGTAGPRGRWSPFGDDENDGVVAVDEVTVTDGDAVQRVPGWHTLLMDHAGARKVVLEALARG